MNKEIREAKLKIASLKKEERERQKCAKEERKWVSLKRHTPDANLSRVVAWSEGIMVPCWWNGEAFFQFDGTWMLSEKEKLETVTHWSPCDWMASSNWPNCGPSLRARIEHLWGRILGHTQSAVNFATPKRWNRNAQLSRKVVYYKNASGRVLAGGPENMPAPYGFEKVVCNSASDAERWSSHLRRLDNIDHEQIQRHREAVEAPIREEVRSELRHKMANARNNVNRDFLAQAMKRLDGKGAQWQYRRESRMAIEAYEESTLRRG